MLQTCTALFCAMMLLLPAAARAGDKQIRAADVPRAFTGEFQWQDSDEPFTLELKIDTIELKGGMIRFTGSHLYLPGELKAKIEGTIDPKSGRLTIRELESDPGIETDGAFEGRLAGDLQSIEAVWTSKGTGKEGKLKVKAKK